MRAQYVFHTQNLEVFFSIIISGEFADYFIKMFIFISLECILVQTRMGLDCVT